MEFAQALLSGAFIGSVLGFVGAGGAMLSVPILLYIFHFTPLHATTAALAIVFLAAFSGAIPKYRKGEVLVRDALLVWAFGLTTNLGTAILAKHLPNSFITSGFALILVSAGISMLRAPALNQAERKVPIINLIFISLGIGCITGIFGVGGGFVMIPVLVLGFNISQVKAAGTSLLIIALNCLTSFLGHQSVWHQIHWQVPIEMAISAVIISTVASNYASRAPQKTLRKSFAYLLFLIAIWTVLKTWFLG
jgi:uncharacterized protein